MRELRNEELVEVSGGTWTTTNTHTRGPGGGYTGTTVTASRTTGPNSYGYLPEYGGQTYAPDAGLQGAQLTGFQEELSTQEMLDAFVNAPQRAEEARQELCAELESERVEIQGRIDAIEEQFDAHPNGDGSGFAEFAQKLGPLAELRENEEKQEQHRCG